MLLKLLLFLATYEKNLFKVNIIIFDIKGVLSLAKTVPREFICSLAV